MRYAVWLEDRNYAVGTFNADNPTKIRERARKVLGVRKLPKGAKIIRLYSLSEVKQTVKAIPDGFTIDKTVTALANTIAARARRNRA